jgi:hypothetical protein
MNSRRLIAAPARITSRKSYLVLRSVTRKFGLNNGLWMSALGQKPTYAPQQVMSALLLKADVCGANRHVCFGPIADIRSREPPMNKEAAAAFSSCEFGSASVVGE